MQETANSEGLSARRAALYIHVPFCQARCAYCDFNTYAGLEELIPTYAAAVCREIEAAGRRWGSLAIPTIYLGGGTPSLLPHDLLAQILLTARTTHHVSHDAEITLEANPGTVTPGYLRSLRSLGVNRLSLGAQSAHGQELRLLGRRHDWAQVVEAMTWARAAGFENLSLDLIFGLPGQLSTRWQATLEATLALTPEHLSLYSLTVEEETPLAGRIARGELPPPDEDLAAEMYELAETLLAAEGYWHYEISNWAKANQRIDKPALSSPPRACRGVVEGAANRRTSEEVSRFVCHHNLAYWRNEPWLGVGAGGHSWWDGKRWANVRHPRDYIAALEADEAPVETEETIDRRLEMGETMMMGLRLAEGVRDERFRARFDAGLAQVFEEALDELQGQGLLIWDGRTACLTARGRLLGNRVFARFL